MALHTLLMKQDKVAFSYMNEYRISKTVCLVYTRFLTFWIYKHEPWSYPPCMVNPHCDPDWFLLRRTSTGPSLILNTLRRKKTTAAGLKSWFVFCACRRGVVISISPEHNSPSLQPPCKMLSIYIHTACQENLYRCWCFDWRVSAKNYVKCPPSAPCPAVLWTVTNGT